MSDTALFEKFNSSFDLEGLKADVTNAASGGDYEDVPHGDYEVSIAKLELGETGPKSKAPGMPQAKVWFKIVAGDFKGQLIFMNQNLTNGFGIHTMNKFLESLDSGIGISFENFVQYANLLESVYQAVANDEYQLAYGENAKGYNTFNIVTKFTD